MNGLPRILLLAVSLAWAATAGGCNSGSASTAADGGEEADAATGDDGKPADDGTSDSGPADTVDAGTGDADTEDADTVDAGTGDAGTEDADTVDAGAGDTGLTDAGSATDADSSQDEGLPEWPDPTPIQLTPTYFGADATAPRGVSAWAIENYPGALPDNARNTIFWGRFQNNACASPGYGLNVEHPLTIAGSPVFRAFYPDCDSNYGPSVDADIYAYDVPQHLLRCEISPGGAFQSFGTSGQNATGANAYIQGIYTSFNPPWQTNVPNRLRPWGGPSTDSNLIRFALRVRASVMQAVLEDPDHQQIQQALWMNVINESCSLADSSSYCQIQFNFKSFNRGLGAYTSFTEGSAFNDGGQGGLIAVIGPIAAVGQSTNVSGSSAWTSWGSSTHLDTFADETFQVEISWSQFQQLLMNVTGGNPAAVYGDSWQDRNAWVLLDVGYGLENYNQSTTQASLVDGLFETVEIFSL